MSGIGKKGTIIIFLGIIAAEGPPSLAFPCPQSRHWTRRDWKMKEDRSAKDGSIIVTSFDERNPYRIPYAAPQEDRPIFREDPHKP